MQPSIAIFKWMDIDKAKGDNGGLYDGINILGAHPVITNIQCCHQFRHITLTGTNEFRHRVMVMIPVTKKNTVFSITKLCETVVTEQDAM